MHSGKRARVHARSALVLSLCADHLHARRRRRIRSWLKQRAGAVGIGRDCVSTATTGDARDEQIEPRRAVLSASTVRFRRVLWCLCCLLALPLPTAALWRRNRLSAPPFLPLFRMRCRQLRWVETDSRRHTSMCMLWSHNDASRFTSATRGAENNGQKQSKVLKIFSHLALLFVSAKHQPPMVSPIDVRAER